MSFGIAIVGSHEETKGFSALGVDAFPVKDHQEAVEVLFQIKNALESSDAPRRYAVVFILEEIFREIPEETYRKLSAGGLPSLISLPGSQGSTGFGNEKIRRIVEQAVGSDIFGGK
ncbi:V-type ATP synthase subunit F [Candidatus Peregrinibacteria bacterium]|nr:MAG: V-type ATP synthase subunit F [Candidatus Peregrinibacteria bacterium]